MSGNPLEVLIKHQLWTSRSGQAACSEPECGWRLDFKWEKGEVPEYVGVSHAAHQLELLGRVGYQQIGSTKADVALSRIADEVQLMEWGGVITGECGPVWVEPARPFPRGGRMIKAILTEGGWK